MSLQNDTTVNSYNAMAQAYVERDSNRTWGNFYTQWITDSFKSLGKNAKILEIGSAYGRDASYLSEMGYHVQVSDASTAFLECLEERGFKPIKLDIISQTLAERYDAVYASAVFLHFTREDFRMALQNVFVGLNSHGKFIFNLIEGEGEKTSTSQGVSRYFCYWQAESLERILAENGFNVVDMKKDKFEQEAWLYVVAEKMEAET